MKKLKFWLTSLLLLQVLLAAALLWNNQREIIKNQPKPLLNIAWKTVDKLTIEDTSGGITLVKNDQSWSLSNQQLPVSNEDINEFFHQLEELKTGWPVATLSSSHKRFEVSDDKFVRRLHLYSKGKVIGKLFFGSSIGLRQSNVRRDGDDSIYNAQLDTLDISANPEIWFDKSLLAASDISAIKGPDYNLKRNGATWGFNRSGPSIFLGNSKQGRLDQDKVDELAEALANLPILKISSLIPDLNAEGTEKVKIEITDDKGSWIYHFIKAGDSYYVSRNDREELFTLDKTIYEKIAAVKQSELIFAKPTSSTTPDESTQ